MVKIFPGFFLRIYNGIYRSVTDFTVALSVLAESCGCGISCCDGNSSVNFKSQDVESSFSLYVTNETLTLKNLADNSTVELGPPEPIIAYISDTAPLTNNYDYRFWGDSAPYVTWEQWENGALVRSETVDTFADVTWTLNSTDRQVRAYPPDGNLAAVTGGTYWSSYYIENFNSIFRQLPGVDYVAVTAAHQLAGELGDWSAMTSLDGLEFWATGDGVGFGFQTANEFDIAAITDYIDFFGNRIDVSGINRILVKIDEAGASNGYLDIAGGTNAAPDASSGGFNGTAALANLIGKGWTVSTN